MTYKSKTLILAISGILISGCATSTDTTRSDFGVAVKHNIAVQAVQPTPEQKANTFIPADPDRRDLARQRYKADEVEKPVATDTME